MEANSEIAAVSVKEEPVDADILSGEEDFAVNCRQLCSVQYEDEAAGNNGQPQSRANRLAKADPSVKAEPPDNRTSSGASEVCSSKKVKKEEVVEPLAATESLVNEYSAKCELICAAENEELDNNKEPQPTPSTSTASKEDEDKFEFISVGAIKEEEPEWTSDPEDPNPNPLQGTGGEDKKSALQQDHGPDSSSNAGDSTTEEFECGLCQRIFYQRHVLLRHLGTHAMEKQFHCDTCEKDFKYRAHLVRHGRTHVGEMPYQCKHCHKRFSKLSMLTNHSKQHAVQYPHHCGVCKTKFTNLSDLTNHSMMHVLEERYHCKVCKKQFDDMSDLTSHSSVHTGQNTYGAEYMRYLQGRSTP